VIFLSSFTAMHCNIPVFAGNNAAAPALTMGSQARGVRLHILAR